AASVDADIGGSSQRHRAQDLEIEQRYANLLTPIRDLTKNWEVDISAYLDQYLEELSQTPVGYQNGESTVNFTRAAFLIQGSASVYGKKVEYLYSLVQKLASEMTHRGNSGETGEDAQGVAKTAAGASHRRKADYGFSLQEDMGLGENLDDAVGGRTGRAGRKTRLKRQRRLPLQLVLFEEDKQTRLLDVKGDVVGHQSDYMLHELPECSCDPDRCRCHRTSLEGQRRLDDSDEVSVADPADFDGGGLNVSGAPHLSGPLPDLDISGLGALHEDVGAFEECRAKPDVEPEPEPAPVPLPRNSSVGRRIKEENRVKKEFFSPFRCQDIILVHKFYDPMEDTSALNKPIKIMRRARKRPLKESDDVPPIYVRWAIEGPFPEAYRKELELQKKGEIMPGGERLYKKALEAMKSMDAAVSGKEGFEETVPPEEDDDGCAADDPCKCEPEPDEEKGIDWPDLGPDRLAEPEPGATAAASEEGSDKDSYGTLVHSYLRECQEPMNSFQLTDLQKRVAEWENKIRPTLEEEEEREPYDIRTYCGRLLDRFGDGPSKQSMAFRSVVQGGPVWEVPRYFVASLQLANNRNVALTTDGVLDAGMDTLQLTLLSRRQHFEELDDFGTSQATSQAPSQAPSSESRKRKAVSRRPPPRDPGDVLRENPLVLESCRDGSREARINGERPPPGNHARARMRAKAAAIAALADDSDDGGNDENVAIA
ncbi:unnamed protein product, partial [Ixodes pacificus]